MFSTPIGLKTCTGLTCTDSVQFQTKIPKISYCGSRSPKYKNLVISRCCFAEDGIEMYQDSKRTCTAIVLLIKPFVCCRSRRRGLLKLPIYIGETGRTLRERFGEHLRSINKNAPGFPVAEHFSFNGHTAADALVRGNKQRKRQKMRLNFRLGTCQPRGLKADVHFI